MGMEWYKKIYKKPMEWCTKIYKKAAAAVVGSQNDSPVVQTSKGFYGELQKYRRKLQKYTYWLLGFSVLSYGAYYFRDSIPFLEAEQPDEKEVKGYSKIQKGVGACALLVGALGAVAGYKHFSKHHEEESRNASGFFSTSRGAAGKTFWHRHGLKLGLVIIFLAGLAALAFYLSKSKEKNGDLPGRYIEEWGPPLGAERV